jgi:hypothetical protein
LKRVTDEQAAEIAANVEKGVTDEAVKWLQIMKSN